MANSRVGEEVMALWNIGAKEMSHRKARVAAFRVRVKRRLRMMGLYVPPGAGTKELLALKAGLALVDQKFAERQTFQKGGGPCKITKRSPF